jgi:hypothetical protein
MMTPMSESWTVCCCNDDIRATHKHASVNVCMPPGCCKKALIPAASVNNTGAYLSVSLRLYLRFLPSVVAGDSERPLLLPPVPMSSTALPTFKLLGVSFAAGHTHAPIKQECKCMCFRTCQLLHVLPQMRSPGVPLHPWCCLSCSVRHHPSHKKHPAAASVHATPTT